MADTSNMSFDSPNAQNSFLTGGNAETTDVDQPWEQDNQAWWDWYVSLGDPSIETEVDQTARIAEAEAKLKQELETIAPATDTELAEELATPYLLGDSARDRFQAQGFIKLPNVFSGAALARLRLEMRRLFTSEFAIDADSEASDRFLSLEMAWLEHTIIEQFVRSPRIGGLSASLLGVDAVRLYHDNLLAKQPNCGRTPWHNDRHHFPLATDDIVTAWIPAQSVPSCMGPLTFAGPIDAHHLVADIPFDKFGTSYDQKVDAVFRNRDDVLIESAAFDLGDVSFHHNLCFHSAGSNQTRFSRMVLANTYFADGAHVVDRPTMVSGDWQKFMPGVEAGQRVDSSYNPICGYR